MTRLPEDMVREFHERFGFHIENAPATPPAVIRVERSRLIGEEAAEVVAELLAGLPDRERVYLEIVDAFAARAWPPSRPLDLTKLAGEHGDLAYVNSGGAVNAGIPLTAVVAEVHAANMRKLGPDGKPIYSEHGKALKPEGWQPPDIVAVLAGTATRPGIRPVTYWEAWCTGDGSGEHLIEFGDCTGWSDRDSAESAADDGEHVLLRDGRVFCRSHIPVDVCPDSEDNRHEAADDQPDECAHCGRAGLSAATPQAVTA